MSDALANANRNDVIEDRMNQKNRDHSEGDEEHHDGLQALLIRLELKT